MQSGPCGPEPRWRPANSSILHFRSGVQATTQTQSGGILDFTCHGCSLVGGKAAVAPGRSARRVRQFPRDATGAVGRPPEAIPSSSGPLRRASDQRLIWPWCNQGSVRRGKPAEALCARIRTLRVGPPWGPVGKLTKRRTQGTWDPGSGPRRGAP